MTHPSSLSVVIPAHNAAATIGEQLAALRRQDSASLRSVVVVDSFCTDETVAVVQQVADEWPKVRIVTAERRGANAARNRGVLATDTDWIVMCDADDVVDDRWICALEQALETADLVRGRYELDRLNSPATISARGSLESTARPESARFGGLGGSCGFTRAAWEQLEGMQEHHYGADDAEFFWRAHQANLCVRYAHDAVSHYRLRPDMKGLYRQQRLWASSRAQLYREFGRSGFVVRQSPVRAIRTWGWLVRHALDSCSADPALRGRWVRVAAGVAGRLQGSVRHRVWYP